MAVIQWSRIPGMSPYGILLCDPERMSRKEASLLFHPEWGLARTMLTVINDGERLSPAVEETVASWDVNQSAAVVVRWRAGPFEVTERFRVQENTSSLIREVMLTPEPNRPVGIECALYANPLFFDEFSTRPHGGLQAVGYCALGLYAAPSGRAFERFVTVDVPAGGTEPAATFVYNLEAVGTHEFSLYPDASPFTPLRHAPLTDLGVAFASAIQQQVQTGKQPSLASRIMEAHRLAAISLRAAVSELGKFDASIWQYDFEWGMDAAMVATAAASCGLFDLARSVLRNILTRLSNEQGMIAEASRFRGGGMSELNGNGAVLDAIWHYWKWSGDETLLRAHWRRICAIADYPLKPEFQHESGMLKTVRDFWERTPWMGVDEGFELAHQVWCGVGLRRIAELAELMGEQGRSAEWRVKGEKIIEAMLNDPKWRLVHEGRFIRRRRTDGTVQEALAPSLEGALPEYAPYIPKVIDGTPRAWEPCVTEALPIVYGLIDPRGEIARATLDTLESLWNPTGIGGYARYNIESDPDSPGPWPFATAFMAAAQIEARMEEQAARSIDWLLDRAGPGVSWMEFYGSRPTPPFPPVGVIVWGWAQFLLLVNKHIVGTRVDGRTIHITPKLVGIEHRVRFGRYCVNIQVHGFDRAMLDTELLPLDGSTASIPLPLTRDHRLIFLPLTDS